MKYFSLLEMMDIYLLWILGSFRGRPPTFLERNRRF